MAGKNGQPNGRRRKPARPAWQRLTKRQKEEFLEHVREGDDRPTAAAKVRSTARAFRALCTHDPLFEAAYEEARTYHETTLKERLGTTIWECALDPSPKRDRIRMWLGERMLPGFARPHQVELTGRDGGPLEHRLFDPTKLSLPELEELESLLVKASLEEG